jgi:hypothetical protein
MINLIYKTLKFLSIGIIYAGISRELLKQVIAISATTVSQRAKD